MKSQQEEEGHETADKHKPHDGDEGNHNDYDGKKTIKSSEEKTQTARRGHS